MLPHVFSHTHKHFNDSLPRCNSAITVTPVPEAQTKSITPTVTPISAQPAVTFTEDQIKGFIFNLSHYLVSYLSGFLTPFCDPYQTSFVEETAESFGCRAITAKFFIQNLKVAKASCEFTPGTSHPLQSLS